MAVAKRGHGHCLVPYCGVLLLIICSCTARGSIQAAGSGKRDPIPQPSPTPDQHRQPGSQVDEQLLESIARDPAQSGTYSDISLQAQGSAEQLGSDAGTQAQQMSQQQQQQQEQQQQQQANSDQLTHGEKGAEREPDLQPQAQHSEQLPGNGAQVCLSDATEPLMCACFSLFERLHSCAGD